MMEPRQANFRNRTRAPTDHEAGVARQSHEEIAGIAHAARNEHGARPVLQFDIVGGNNAHDGATGCERTFRRDTRGWTAAPTDERETESGDQFTGIGRKIVRARSGLGAAQDAYLCRAGNRFRNTRMIRAHAAWLRTFQASTIWRMVSSRDWVMSHFG